MDEAQVGENLPPFHHNCRCRIVAENETLTEELLSREDEIALILEFLRYINDWGIEEFGWRTKVATDAALRRIAADLVDVLRAIRAVGSEAGFVDVTSGAVNSDVLHALMRLAGFVPNTGMSLLDTVNVVNMMQDALGNGPGWPYVDVQTVFHLAMQRAVPDSALQGAVHVGTGLFVLGIPVAASAFVGWLATPAAMGTAGATTTTAAMYWERLKGLVQRGYMPPPGGGGITRTILSNGKVITFGHGGRHFEGAEITMRQVQNAIADHVVRMFLSQGFNEFTIVVRGVSITYRAFLLPNGVINIGTHFIQIIN